MTAADLGQSGSTYAVDISSAVQYVQDPWSPMPTGATLEIAFYDGDGSTETIELTQGMSDEEIIAEFEKMDGVSAYKDSDGKFYATGDALEGTTKYGLTILEDGKAPAMLPHIPAEAVEVTTRTTVADIDISTQAGAEDAIEILDGALAQVDAQRAELGAVQNRLDYTIANLQNTQENLTTSQSRIQDVDFAKETTELTKNQMMMQAGTTVLAQTKQMPQYAVQMLG